MAKQIKDRSGCSVFNNAIAQKFFTAQAALCKTKNRFENGMYLFQEKPKAYEVLRKPAGNGVFTCLGFPVILRFGIFPIHRQEVVNVL
jgi:hypothetical protein